MALGLVLGLAAGAGTGIYECVGPDGKTVFTSDANACPGTKPHVLQKQLQTVVEGQGQRSRPAARRSGGSNDGIERMWRSKRPAAEQELRQAEEHLRQMLSVVKSCNRGGEWYQTGESGIRQHIPCEELRDRLQEAQQKRDDLVEYLANGLEDECRRAGCQPGWVR
jgi:hypothetical protein